MSLIPRRDDASKDPERTLGSALSRFRAEIDHLMDHFFRDPWLALDRVRGPLVGWSPSIDVVDEGKEFVLRVELPGVDPEDIELTISGGMLTIAGEKRDAREEKTKTFHRSECSFGTFKRSLSLPEGADSEKGTADYSNGVLTVRIGKSKSAAAKRIPVSRSSRPENE